MIKNEYIFKNLEFSSKIEDTPWARRTTKKWEIIENLLIRNPMKFKHFLKKTLSS